MIKVGTLCVITYTGSGYEKYLGRFCTVVACTPVDEIGHDNMVDIAGVVLLGADKCLMPVDDGQHKNARATTPKEIAA